MYPWKHLHQVTRKWESEARTFAKDCGLIKPKSISQNARLRYYCSNTLSLGWWTPSKLFFDFFKKVVEEALHIWIVALLYICSSYLFRTFAVRHVSYFPPEIVHDTMEGWALQ